MGTRRFFQQTASLTSIVALLATATASAAVESLGPYASPAETVAAEPTKGTADAAAAVAKVAVQQASPAAPEHISAAAAPTEKQSLGQPAHAARESLPLPAASSARSPLTGSVARTAVSLGIVVGLIILLASLYKKFGAGAKGFSLLPNGSRTGAGPSGIVEVLARYPLDTGLTLVLLKVDRRVLLLSQSGSLGMARFFGRKGAGSGRGGGGASLSTLAEFTEPGDVASILSRISDADGSSMNARFRQLVERFGGEHDGALADDARVETSGRLIRTNDEGDSAELLDERSLLLREAATVEAPETPPTYAFRAPSLGAAPPRVHQAPAARRTTPEPDSVAALKRRLESMRATGGGR